VRLRFGSLRRLAALQHLRKQPPATLCLPHILWGNCAASTLEKSIVSLCFGVRKNPFIEVTPL